MTIHYHGTPITPRSVLLTLKGRFFCVSHADHRDVGIAHQIGQGVMLDNGAFSAWRIGKPTRWPEYYQWVEPWLDWHTTWAVVPDVIGGDDEANDELIRQWPHGYRGAPVWHMHESINRLQRLCEEWPRVCVGSSGTYSHVGGDKWRRRMDEAMDAVCPNGRPMSWLHLLRGMKMAGDIYPFASVDSADIARNHNGKKDPVAMANRWDALQCAGRWVFRGHQNELTLNASKQEAKS